MKNTFVNNEIWILTFGGGFQRSYAYKSESTVDERTEFKNELRVFIRTLLKTIM